MKVKLLTFFLMILMVSFIGCEHEKDRKIKLSDEPVSSEQGRQFTTTIHIEPKQRLSIAVMFFQNRTGDNELQWLQKGLTEMLIRTLSQSRSLSVLSADRLFEVLDRLDKTASGADIDLDMAAIVSKEANVDAILTGSITQSGDSLRIIVKVHEPNQGMILREESVEGAGLEKIFAMVDELTHKIRNGLQLTLDKAQPSRGIAELSTKSLEAWRYYTSGVDLMNKYMLSDALNQFEKATELDSTFVSAYLYLSRLLDSQGETQKGHQALQKLLSLRNKATPQEKYQIDRLEAGINLNIRRIIDVSHQWLQQYPDDRDANLNLAQTYYSFQNYDPAIQYYQKVLEIDPKYILAHNMLGYIYASTGDYSNAVTSLNTYKELAPDEPNPYDSMGDVFLYQGDYEQAKKAFEQALRINDKFTPSLLHLGDTYLEKGEYAKALKIFNESLEVVTDPTDKANVHTQIGFVQWRLGQTEDAVMNLKKSLQYRGFQYLVMTWLNEVYKDYDDEIARLQSLRQNYDFVKKTTGTYPTRLYTLANLSLWYDINIEGTIGIINEILETTDNPTAQMWGRYILAPLYLKANQLDEYKRSSEDFIKNFMAIVELVPDIPRTYSVWRNFSILSQYAYQFTDEGIEKYNRLITFCLEKELKISEMVFRSFLADLYFHAGEREKALEQLRIAGIPEESKWLVIGPFDNKNGFNKEFPPEKEIKLDKFYEAKSQSITWQRANDGFHDGYVDLQKILKQYNWSVGYGLVHVNSPEEKDIQIRVGTNDAAKIWLNDELVWKLNIGRDASFDDDIVNVSLQPGLNEILIKVCNRISLWGYYFRLTDKEGNGLPDIHFVSPDEQVQQVLLNAEKANHFSHWSQAMN
jgi:tetratricopeptide (TPR) repeat protein